MYLRRWRTFKNVCVFYNLIVCSPEWKQLAWVLIKWQHEVYAGCLLEYWNCTFLPYQSFVLSVLSRTTLSCPKSSDKAGWNWAVEWMNWALNHDAVPFFDSWGFHICLILIDEKIKCHRYIRCFAPSDLPTGALLKFLVQMDGEHLTHSQQNRNFWNFLEATIGAWKSNPRIFEALVGDKFLSVIHVCSNLSLYCHCLCGKAL